MVSLNDQIKHPWQNGPAELIAHAIEHMHKNTDFDQRIAFLLLDVGVETLFKTVLLLPESEAKTKMLYENRKKVVNENSFYKLVDGVTKAYPYLQTKYKKMSHILFYHDKRNQLYHEGNGITVEVLETKNYADLAVKLLRDLLDVDLDLLFRAPEIKARELQLETDHRKLEQEKLEIQRNWRAHLEFLGESVAELTAPMLTQAKFFRIMGKYFTESPQKALDYLRTTIEAQFPELEMREAALDQLMPPGVSDLELIINRYPGYFLQIAQMRLDKNILSIYSVAYDDLAEQIDFHSDMYIDPHTNEPVGQYLSDDEVHSRRMKGYAENIAALQYANSVLENWLKQQDSLGESE